jgi:hypothetical protein
LSFPGPEPISDLGQKKMETIHVSTSKAGTLYNRFPRHAKRTEVVVLLYSTSSASDTETPRSFFATIEAENRFPSHHHAQKCIRAGKMLFAYFALFANPVKTILMPLIQSLALVATNPYNQTSYNNRQIRQ